MGEGLAIEGKGPGDEHREKGTISLSSRGVINQGQKPRRVGVDRRSKAPKTEESRKTGRGRTKIKTTLVAGCSKSTLPYWLTPRETGEPRL